MLKMLNLPAGFSIEERGERAEKYFLEGYNCAQSVVLAFSDLLPELSEETLKNLSAGFGGGFGRLREVCGAVSGMTMLSGLLAPSSDPADKVAKTANYALVQDMADAFRKERGSIVCRDLLNIKMDAKENPRPSDRTPEYYRSRPCAANVGLAARILASRLLAAD